MLVPRSVFHLHAITDEDALRYAIGGVRFHHDPDSGKQIAVATDGRRLIAATWAVEDAFDAEATIHASICTQVIAMTTGTINRVVMTSNEGRIALSANHPPCNTTLDVLPLDGRFPEYHSTFLDSRDKDSTAVVLDVALFEEMLATFRQMGVERVVLAVADADSPISLTGEDEDGVSLAGLLMPSSAPGDAVEVGWMPGVTTEPALRKEPTDQ